MSLYVITDWLSLIPIGFAAGFAVLGLLQWVGRKKLSAVDSDVLLLGGFYVVTGIAYLIFEICIINVRPVLINEMKEASYPSSTTVLVLCIMSTAIMQMYARISNRRWRNTVILAMIIFSAFMVIGRTVCGVHWLTDIVGGILLSSGLVMLYRSLCHFK
jgi:undecaprenyl-diphosphatase